MKLIVTGSFDESSRHVAARFAEVIREKPDALIGCATGSSTVGIYRHLAAQYEAGTLDFAKVRTVNVDEYMGIGPGHGQSFAHFMGEHFFTRVNLAPENCYLVDGAGDPAGETARFRAFLGGNRMDILMLGIGTNGHVGFNEPAPVFTAGAHVVALAEDTIRANSRFFQDESEVPRHAMTMGIGDIAKARRVCLIASGAAKADAVRRLFADDSIDPRLPCTILKACPDAEVVIDRELAQAAGLIQTQEESN